MASLLDLFGLKTKKAIRSDDVFLDSAKQSPDIWTEIFSEKLSCVVACPSSSALGEENITREYIMTHILLPERKPGDFVNIYGQKLSLVGNDFHCGTGFPEKRKVKIITIETIMDGKGNSASIYRTNRPFIGGIASPEEPEEVTFSIMHKFVAMLRAYPEAESVFNMIDKYTQEVNFVGQQSLDSFLKIKPSLKSSLESHWLKCTERLCQPGSVSGLGSDATSSKQIVGQVVESYIMSAIGPSVYQWICRQLVIESGHFLSCTAIMQSYTQTDLGIRPELQCPQNEAVRMLRTLSDASTPMDKLLILKKTVMLIREGVDKNVQSKFLNCDVELATDDIVCFVIWVIIKASKHYENIYYDIHYAADYHFVPSSKTDLGFCMNHFQVAFSWIIGHAMTDGSKFTSIGGEEDDHDDDELMLEIGTGILKRTADGELPHGICTSAAIAIERFINAEKFNHNIVEDDYYQKPLPLSTDHLTESYANTWSADSSPMSSEYHKSIIPAQAANRVELVPRSHISATLSENEGTSIKMIGRAEYLTYPEESHTEVKVYSEESNKLCAISSICGGKGYYLAIDTSCRLYSWGNPSCGRLGHSLSYEMDSFVPLSRPMQVISIGSDMRIRQVACGSQHTIAVAESGEVFAWGDNRCAQLGIHSTTGNIISGIYTTSINAIMASSPILVEGVKHERIISAACGAFHTICLTVNGALYSWGRAANGRLGQFTDRNIPEHSVSRPSIVRGPWMGMALTSPQSSSLHAKVAGKSSSSSRPTSTSTTSLSHNSNSNNSMASYEPEQQAMVHVIPAISISAGHSHSLAITSQGEVYTWGCGTYGRLGHGSHMDEFVPKLVSAFNRPGIDISSASCGAGHSLFLTKEGFLFGCGWNRYHQVAAEEISTCRSSYSFDSECILVPQPILISTTSSSIAIGSTLSLNDPKFKLVESIACGEHHSAVISKEKRLYMWGLALQSNSFDPQVKHHDMTDLLPKSTTPKQIACAGQVTMALI